MTHDHVVETVREKLKTRAMAGLKKYGVGMDREDLTYKDWLIHAQEEAMDLALYLQKLIDGREG